MTDKARAARSLLRGGGRLYLLLRRRMARGRPRSRYWVPRIGDRVRLDGEGTWLVYGVSARRAVVELGKPGVVRLDRVTPCSREDLAKHYGTDLDRKNRPIFRPGVIVPQTEEPEPEEEPTEPFRLHSVPDPETDDDMDVIDPSA